MVHRMADNYAPHTLNEAHTSTGKGASYLVSACPTNIVGTSTIRLPRNIVSTACHQSVSSLIRSETSIQAGTDTIIDTRSAT